jgi:transcriptional regulator with XRE-family HTH domain
MLGHIENGRRSGTADTLEKIADAFNLRIGVLIDPDYDLDRAAEISRIVEASSHLEDDQLRVVLDMIEALKSSR